MLQFLVHQQSRAPSVVGSSQSHSNLERVAVLLWAPQRFLLQLISESWRYLWCGPFHDEPVGLPGELASVLTNSPRSARPPLSLRELASRSCLAHRFHVAGVPNADFLPATHHFTFMEAVPILCWAIWMTIWFPSETYWEEILFNED